MALTFLFVRLPRVIFFIVVFCIVAHTGDVKAADVPLRTLSLKESLQLAKKNSTSLQTEERKLLAAKLNMKNVDLDLVPDLLVGASYQYDESTEDNLGDIKPFVTLSQVVFNSATSYSKQLEALSRLINSKIQLYSKQNELFSNVITNYFTLIQAQNKSQLENHFYKQSQVEFKKAQIRSQDGQISKMELLQNESMLSFAKIEQEAGQNRIEYKAMELSSLLNFQKETRVRAGDTFIPVFYSIDFDACKKYAKSNNPIIRLNDQLLKKVPEFRDLIPRLQWPTVSLSAYVGAGANQWESEQSYGISVTATKSLYDFGKTNRKQQILALELDSMENSIQQSRKKMFSHLKRLHKEFVDSGKIVQKLLKLNGTAEKLFKVLQKNYELGLISYETLLKGQKDEIVRRNNYLSAVHRYLAAEMLLKLSSGVSDIELLSKQDPDWFKTTPPDDATTLKLF